MLCREGGDALEVASALVLPATAVSEHLNVFEPKLVLVILDDLREGCVVEERVALHLRKDAQRFLP